MSWSLPPAHPGPAGSLDLLLNNWSCAKAWSWLRAGVLPLEKEPMDLVAAKAFGDLGIAPRSMSKAWNMSTNELADPWVHQVFCLPATPEEDWPKASAQIAETPIGLVAALVANGWNPFKKFMVVAPANASEEDTVGGVGYHPVWGIELLMGFVGENRVSPAWRLALIDQMFRSPHCPPAHELASRRVCQTKKSNLPAVSWLTAAIRYRLPLAARACVDHGLGMGEHEAWPENTKPQERAWWESNIIQSSTLQASSARRSRRL